ncbi:hypothetical protein KM043_001034 [Ampulex compressa]|nr:hypothetical protein KM043_001034 [Ampulex compressa]
MRKLLSPEQRGLLMRATALGLVSLGFVYFGFVFHLDGHWVEREEDAEEGDAGLGVTTVHDFGTVRDLGLVGPLVGSLALSSFLPSHGFSRRFSLFFMSLLTVLR